MGNNTFVINQVSAGHHVWYFKIYPMQIVSMCVYVCTFVCVCVFAHEAIND